MILVDSCGWLQFLGDGPLAEHYQKFLADPGSVLTPTIVAYEVGKKIMKERGPDLVTLVAAAVGKTKVVPLTDELAFKAAETSLKYSLPMADAIVYATALAYNARVATGDAHFARLDHVLFIQASD